MPLPPAPPSAWMLKPLTKITDSAAAGQNVFGGLFRGLATGGSDKWEKRHVSLSGTVGTNEAAVVYGRSIDKKDKRVKLDTITSVRAANRDEMREAKCPSAHSSKGWVMRTSDGKEIFWAVAEGDDGEAIRDEWVDFLQEMIPRGAGGNGNGGGAQQQHQSSAAGSLGKREGKANADSDDDDEFDDDDLITQDTNNNNNTNNNKNKNTKGGGRAHDDDDDDDDDDTRSEATTVRGNRKDNDASYLDSYVDEDGNKHTALRNKSQKELDRLAGFGGEDEDEDDIDRYLNDYKNENGSMAGDDFLDDLEDDIDLDDDDEYDDDGTNSAGGTNTNTRRGGKRGGGGRRSGAASSAGGGGGQKRGGDNAAISPSTPFESKEQLYKKFLIPIAIKNGAAVAADISSLGPSVWSKWEKNNYLYLPRDRMKGYKSHLLAGDAIGKPATTEEAYAKASGTGLAANPTFLRLINGTVRFARFMIKIAKRDNYHERDILITDKHLYLFAKGSFGRWIPRVIDIDQIVGVVESSTDPSIFAIIVPSFHDIFIKVQVKGEGNGGTINNDPDNLTVRDVKHQIIAHLFCAHMTLVTNRTFIFRESDNIASVIRRTEDDQHLPLQSQPDDRLRIASSKEIYPTLRTNADTIVYFSSYCDRIAATLDARKRALVLTDNAIYTITEKLDAIARRTGLTEIYAALYNMAELKVLFKGGDTDTLVQFRAEEELVRLMELVGQVTLKAVGRQLEFSPHGDLFSQAQLVGTAKMMKFVRPNMSQAKIRKMIRMIGAKSVTGVGLLGSGVKAVTGVGYQTIKTVGKGVGGVIVDNAITGEVIGMISAAGNAAIGLGGLGNTSRLIYETVLTIEDEDKAIAAPRPFPDRLQLSRKDSLVASQNLGEVFFSSRCRVYNLSSHIDTEKTEQRIACVSSNGGLIFYIPHDTTDWNVMNNLIKIFSTNKGLDTDFKFELSQVKGIITCTSEPTVVGLMTAKHTDVLLRLPNETTAAQFVRYLAAAVTRFSNNNSNGNSNGSGNNNNDNDNSSGIKGVFASKSNNNNNNNASSSRQSSPPSSPFADVISPYCYRTACPIYSVPTTAQLKVVLRKSLLDPQPTVACRALPSDTLLLSRIPSLIEACRRYCDTTIAFSGMAWRFKTETTKKSDEKMADVLGAAGVGGNKRAMKSFVLMLTGTAVYDVTKGNYGITRRLPLRKIRRVTLSTEDPDALVLHVPSEHDFLIRVAGRRKEFMDRLQEVYRK